MALESVPEELNMTEVGNCDSAGARSRFQPACARNNLSRLGRDLNIEFEHGFGGKLRWLIRLQTGI